MNRLKTGTGGDVFRIFIIKDTLSQKHEYFKYRDRLPHIVCRLPISAYRFFIR
jgi:hypothetical protein